MSVFCLEIRSEKKWGVEGGGVGGGEEGGT